MRNKTVLIVDDIELNRSILCKIIENSYDVVFACNGKEALEILKEKYSVIDAVFLDIVMPEVNGFEVLEQIRNHKNLSHIPVIVTSQLTDYHDEKKALELGAQDFITKPYKAAIIKHKLDNIIRLWESSSIINRIRYDQLTGLYSKEYFINKVGDILLRNRTKEFDIIYLGISYFKFLNNTYGSKGGDEVLKYVAEGIRKFIPSTSLCSRFYADNFFIFIERQKNLTKLKKDDFFINKLNEYIKKTPYGANIKIQCGVISSVDHEYEVEALCDRAELAGRATSTYSNESFTIFSEPLKKRMALEKYIVNNMEKALADGQFKVYYQPKYDVNKNLIIGAEALVRWITPENEQIPIWEFIPFFEKNGFITKMDMYVWEETCKTMRRWMDMNIAPICVSVNISRVDVYNPALLDILLKLVKKYGIPVKNLHLEITESAYVENPLQVVEVMKNLHSAGFVIEMDDFGTGYSSLNMLSEISMDIIKLDMRFIQKEAEKAKGRGIIGFIIGIARWMGLSVVAEGVETEEQIELLRSMECNYIQGYYIAKPMNQNAFETFLIEGKKIENPAPNYSENDFLTKLKINDKQNGKVMVIIDDVSASRTVLSNLFQDDYTVFESENGADAWEYLKRNYQNVEIILLDLLMPVMDGFEMLERIRSNDKMKYIPIIITSQGDKSAAHRTLEMEADDFIEKPYDSVTIYRRVKNVVGNSHYEKEQRQKALENQ